MASPWAKIEAPEPVNFADILSEEAAKDMQAKEDRDLAEFVILSLPQKAPDISQEPPGPLNDEDGSCDSDEVIARRLQKQLDAEYNDMLKRSGKQFNRDSKVSSFSNYGRAERHTDVIDLDSESEDVHDLLEDPSEKKFWDRLDNLAKEFRDVPACGYRMQQNGTMITKNNIAMSDRRNAYKMTDFIPDFYTADDFEMSNEDFNSYKIYSYKGQGQRSRMTKKKECHVTVELGVDQYTRLLLYKMVTNKFLERLNGILSIGKEAVILYADGNPTCPHAKINVPKECVLKVYKILFSEIRQQDKYIRDDYRLKDQMIKQSIRKTIHLRAEKEMHNLNRLKKAGIPCPEVITLKRHILVMSFIGEDHKPAPKLKYAKLDESEYVDAYSQVVSYMKTLYHDARLIHADLSEYNILWHNGKCYFIDVGQSIEPEHTGAFTFLMRDCENVSNFFACNGVQEVKTAEQLFFDITGCNFNDVTNQLRL